MQGFGMLDGHHLFQSDIQSRDSKGLPNWLSHCRQAPPFVRLGHLGSQPFYSIWYSACQKPADSPQDFLHHHLGDTRPLLAIALLFVS